MKEPATTTISLAHVMFVQSCPRGFAQLAASTGLPFARQEGADACRLLMANGQYLLVEQRHEDAIKAALARGDRAIDLDGRCERVPDKGR